MKRILRRNRIFTIVYMLLRDLLSYVKYQSIGSYSQHGEDKKIQELFKEKSIGFYVDLGCSHPFRISNTYLFYRLGWSGVAVDPIPHFKLFWRLWRPRDVFLNCGIGPRSGVLEYYELLPSVLSTFVKDVAYEHVKSGTAAILKTYKVDVLSVHQLLDEIGQKRVDLLSIDVEGLDLDILSALDFDQFRPAVVSVECNSPSCYSNLLELFGRNDYALHAKTGCNLIFKDGLSREFVR